MSIDFPSIVQRRLKELGWYTGDVDGKWGPKSDTAFNEFGVKIGSIDPAVVLHSLFSDSAPLKSLQSAKIITKDLSMAHVALAKSLVGTKEYSGSATNPAILAWARHVGVDGIYREDSTAWCGLFVAYVIARSYPNESLKFNVLGARSWLNFGKAVPPGYGAILVFWRGSKSGWEGHVGIYVGEDETHYFVLGGNQDDMVCIKKLPKSRLLGARIPASVDPNKVIPIKGVGNYETSKSEA